MPHKHDTDDILAPAAPTTKPEPHRPDTIESYLKVQTSEHDIRPTDGELDFGEEEDEELVLSDNQDSYIYGDADATDEDTI